MKILVNADKKASLKPKTAKGDKKGNRIGEQKGNVIFADKRRLNILIKIRTRYKRTKR